MPTELFAFYPPGQSPATLGSGCAAGDTTLTVVIPTGLTIPTIGASNGQIRAMIESEQVIFTAGTTTAGTQTLTATRGAGGTAAAAHASGVTVAFQETVDALNNMVQLSPSAAQTGSANLSGAITSGGLITGTDLNAPHHARHQLSGTDPIAWQLLNSPDMNGFTFSLGDPPIFNSSMTPTAGVIYLSRINTPWTFTSSNVTMWVSGAGATVANAYVALYNGSGTQLWVSADQSTAFSTGGTGAKVMSTSGLVISTSFVWLALLVGSAGTMPVFTGKASNGPYINVNLTNTSYRAAQYLTGQTAMPASLTTTSITASGNQYWGGIS